MNERLAIEAKLDTLLAFLSETVDVADIVVDAIENIDAIDPRGRNARCEPRHHWRASGHQASPRVFGEVVGAHHKARQPAFGIAGLRGNRKNVEDGERR